jgi:6-phosphogluconolactonase
MRRTEPELVVADDPAQEARRLFLETAPRTVVLSGGRTPEALYRLLAETEYPWPEVEVFFGDERCVPAGDVRSNLRMARRALLDHVPARAYAMDGSACDADGYEQLLHERFGDDPAFDLAIYGLGPDGHTASLFPNAPALDVTDRRAVTAEAGMEPFVARVTMTRPELAMARTMLYLVTGESKADAVQRAFSDPPSPATPASLVRGEHTIALLDAAAAARL